VNDRLPKVYAVDSQTAFVPDKFTTAKGREISQRLYDNAPDTVGGLLAVFDAREALVQFADALDELRKEDAAPQWACCACGSMEGFTTITHGNGADPPDYDVQCSACGSTEVEESPREALHRVIDQLAEANRKIDRLRQ
jgi:hypothetical protein